MAALVQMMAWRWTGDKPLSEAMFSCFADAYMRHLATMSFNWVTDPVKVINELRPEQNGLHFAVDILKRIFSKEKFIVLIRISLQLVPISLFDSTSEFIYLRTWSQRGNTSLLEPKITYCTDAKLGFNMLMTYPLHLNRLFFLANLRSSNSKAIGGVDAH